MLFFFNDTATTEIYTLSLHDALPISSRVYCHRCCGGKAARAVGPGFELELHGTASWWCGVAARDRSEEHTSELQSQSNLVCRLLLEKKQRNPDLSFPPRLHATSHGVI